METSDSGSNSSPDSSPHDPGSSVASSLKEEYQDLLRYAVVTPNFDGTVMRREEKATPMLLQKSGVHSTKVTHFELSLSSDEEAPNAGSHQLSVNLETLPDPSTSGVTNTVNPINPGEPTPTVHIHASTGPVERLGETMTERLPTMLSQSSYSGVKDPELARLDGQLDVWCSELKSNVLAEFIQAKLRSKEQCVAEIRGERERYIQEAQQIKQELERNRELLRTYELSMSRKDEIIASLTKSLHKQKRRVDLARTFSVWRFCYIDGKREVFTDKLASKHYSQKLKSRVLLAWFGLIQGRWKQRAERACQTRAEEVCHQITSEYEGKLAALHHSYEEALQEISGLRQAQSHFEENMKKAFMRGVCALNMEAMTMFHEPSPTHGIAPPTAAYTNTTEQLPGVPPFPSRPVHPVSGVKSPSTGSLNVKLENGLRKGSRKTKPSVTVERHVPFN